MKKRVFAMLISISMIIAGGDQVGATASFVRLQATAAEKLDEQSLIDKDLLNAVDSPDREYEKENDPLFRENELFENESRAKAYISSYGTELKHDKRFDNYEKVYGTDVSKWQKGIDWAKVKTSGTEFSIIRMGYRGSENGVLTMDTYFAKNISGANSAGVDIGLYFFTQAINTTEAKAEAQYIIQNMKQYPDYLKYPIFIDIEDLAGGRMEKAKLTTKQKTEICKAFCEEIEANGYAAGVYANKYWMENQLTMSELQDYTIWLARYNNEAEYTGIYTMWQYSSTGTVSGIAGGVDMNVCYRLSSPDRPTGLKEIDATDNSITVSWQEQTDVEGYRVCIYETDGTLVSAKNTKKNSYTFSGLKPGHGYKVKLRSYNTNIDSTKSYSKYSQTVQMRTVPGNTEDIKLVYADDEKITIEWEPAEGADGYGLYMYDDELGTYVLWDDVDDTNSTIEGLDTAHKYSFEVKPYIDIDADKRIYVEDAEAFDFCTLPGVVENIIVDGCGTDSVNLSWEEVENASSYNIYYYNNSTGASRFCATTSDTAYQVKSLSSGTKYSFVITAVSEVEGNAVEGKQSVSCRTATATPKVKGLKCTKTNKKSVVLSWTKQSKAKGYIVYCYDKNGKKLKSKTVKANTCTISALASKTTYKFAVRSYALTSSNVKVYGSYSDKLKVKTF